MTYRVFSQAEFLIGILCCGTKVHSHKSLLSFHKSWMRRQNLRMKRVLIDL